MSGSRKSLENIKRQLKNYQKHYNKNKETIGEGLAISDSVTFESRKDQTSANICKSKASQHKSSRKKNLKTSMRIVGHTDYSERSF